MTSLPEGRVSIAGLDKAALLMVLYNGSCPQGAGWLQARRGNMTLEQAREAVGHRDDSSRRFGKDRRGNRDLYFDYVFGRPLKIDLSGDTMDTWLYDRDNGKGSAARLIDELRVSEMPK